MWNLQCKTYIVEAAHLIVATTRRCTLWWLHNFQLEDLEEDLSGNNDAKIVDFHFLKVDSKCPVH